MRRHDPRPLYRRRSPASAGWSQRALAPPRHRGDARAASGAEGAAGAAAGRFDAIALDHDLGGRVPASRCWPRSGAEPRAAAGDLRHRLGDARVAVAALKAGAVDYVWKDVQGHFRELLGESIQLRARPGRVCSARTRSRPSARSARLGTAPSFCCSEVNHRVANSLALVASLAGCRPRPSPTPAAR